MCLLLNSCFSVHIFLLSVVHYTQPFTFYNARFHLLSLFTYLITWCATDNFFTYFCSLRLLLPQSTLRKKRLPCGQHLKPRQQKTGGSNWAKSFHITWALADFSLICLMKKNLILDLNSENPCSFTIRGFLRAVPTYLPLWKLYIVSEKVHSVWEFCRSQSRFCSWIQPLTTTRPRDYAQILIQEIEKFLLDLRFKYRSRIRSLYIVTTDINEHILSIMKADEFATEFIWVFRITRYPYSHFKCTICVWW